MTTPRTSHSCLIDRGTGTSLRRTIRASPTIRLLANGRVNIKCGSAEKRGTLPTRTSSRLPTPSTFASPQNYSIALPAWWHAGLNSRAAPVFPKPRSIASRPITQHGSLPAKLQILTSPLARSDESSKDLRGHDGGLSPGAAPVGGPGDPSGHTSRADHSPKTVDDETCRASGRQPRRQVGGLLRLGTRL